MTETTAGRQAARTKQDCSACRHLVPLDSDCPDYWEHIARLQAEAMEEQAVKIRELIRERNHAKNQAVAAYDLAEQYARRSGVDVTRHDTLKYVEQYWQQRGDFERDWTALESLRWELWQLIMQLERGLEPGPNGEPAPSDKLSGRVMAERFMNYLNILLKKRLQFDIPAKRRADLFARPEPPKSTRVQQGDLFEGAVAVQALRDGGE